MKAGAFEFGDRFTGGTLRVDYVFCGNATHQAIYLQGLSEGGVWAGRRSNLQEPLLRGNGQIRMLDPDTREVLYVNSFSTLFQEWVAYEEARHVDRAFENCFLLPYPKAPVLVQVVLTDSRGRESTRLEHPVDPEDILIRKLEAPKGATAKSIHSGGPVEKAIDIVILAEGYTKKDKRKFFRDAARARDALFGHEPFASHKADFNIRAVFLPSDDRGPSIPREEIWNRTVASSHFDTFYTERYLTSSSQQGIYDALAGESFEHIIVLVNTPVYGGGGIFNNLTIMGSDHRTFKVVLVHEFGHAFAGLADEYAYGETAEPVYPLDAEPWEPNITTLVDFGSKWADLMLSGTDVGLYEGAGYSLTGVYRPVPACRMRINECDDFCPVCTRAIERMIDYCTR